MFVDRRARVHVTRQHLQLHRHPSCSIGAFATCAAARCFVYHCSRLRFHNFAAERNKLRLYCSNTFVGKEYACFESEGIIDN